MDDLLAEPCPDGVIHLNLRLDPGLYQLSAIGDGVHFDWSRLYRRALRSDGIEVDTGPWDFDEKHLPLLPAYGVEIDHRFVGTWVFARVHPDDILKRTFRGRMAFRVHSPRELRMTLTPLHKDPVPWLEARLEMDPEDQLVPFKTQSKATACDSWTDDNFWNQLRHRLDQSTLDWSHLQSMVKGLSLDSGCDSRLCFVLFCATKLWSDKNLMQLSIKLLTELSQQPVFGRSSDKHAYGYGGDMDAMRSIAALVQGYYIFRASLDNELRSAIEHQVSLQAHRFVDSALITRDYWGGSLLQDHGWQSLPGVAAAVLNGRHFIPDADELLEYLIPRVLRSYEAMPRDGSIGTHGDLWRYFGAVTDFRNAWLAASSRDIFSDYPFAETIDYVRSALLNDGVHFLCPPKDKKPLLGGTAFFCAMAETGNSGAAELCARTIGLPIDAVDNPNLPQAARDLNRIAYLENIFSGLLANALPCASSAPARCQAGLFQYDDSGIVLFRNPQQRLTLALKCGPHKGWHSQSAATGPCDRIAVAIGSGHFTLALDDKPILVTPETAWQIRSDLRSCLLIDGFGQLYGDLGYPNCIPSYLHPGERIELCQWDGRQGHIVLDLRPAYPEASGVVFYQREFILSSREIIICRDSVILDRPQPLTWLFQTCADDDVIVSPDGSAIIASKLKVQSFSEAEIQIQVHDSPTVRYLRRDSGRMYRHLAVTTTRQLASVSISFEIAPV